MNPNSGPWPGFPTQYTGHPYYYPGVPRTTNTTNTPHPVPYASDPGSSSATTRLTTNAKEFVPGGTVGPAPVDPSPGFPLPKKKAIRISNPTTGEAVVLRPPDLAFKFGTIPALKPAQPAERPPTKKERKRKAKLEAEEKQRQEEEEREAKRKAEDDERLKKLEEEERKKREEEEQSKWEEEFERRRRKIEEETRVERNRIKEEQREKAEAEAKAKEEKRPRKLAEDADAKHAVTVKGLGKKKEVPPSRSATTSTPGTRTPVSPSQIPGGYLDPFDSGRSSLLKTNEERFRASTKLLGEAGILQFAGSSPRTQDSAPDQDPSVGLASLKKGDTLQLDPDDVVAEEGEISQGNAVDNRNNHITLNAISELSKQMEQLLREMKDLKDEVRELRSLAQREDKRERGKSPYRESSAPEAKPRTATAVSPYFIMKEGELDFAQGDVITLLDPPQDTPSPRGSGWLYGEINITKRGFFPGSYVKLQK